MIFLNYLHTLVNKFEHKYISVISLPQTALPWLTHFQWLELFIGKQTHVVDGSWAQFLLTKFEFKDTLATSMRTFCSDFVYFFIFLFLSIFQSSCLVNAFNQTLWTLYFTDSCSFLRNLWFVGILMFIFAALLISLRFEQSFNYFSFNSLYMGLHIFLGIFGL